MPPRLGSLLATWRGRSLVALLSVLSLLVGLFLGLWLVLNNETASRQAVALTMPRVNALIPGEIRYSSFYGAIGSTVVLEDVEVVDDQGKVCLRARRLEIEWDVWDLTRTTVDLRTVKLQEPEIFISLRSDGTVNLLSAFVPAREKSQGASSTPWTVALRELSLMGGSLVVDSEVSEHRSVELKDMSLSGSYRLSSNRQTVQVDEFMASLVAPLDLPQLKLSGALSLDGGGLAASDVEVSWSETELLVGGAIPNLADPNLDFEVKVARLALADIGRIAGESRLRGTVTGDLHVTGSPAALSATGVLRGTEGSVTIEKLLLDQEKDALAHEVKLTLEDIDLSQFLDLSAELPPSLSGRASWKGKGPVESKVQGVLDISLKPLELGGSSLEVGAAKLLVEGAAVHAESFKLLIAGGTIEGSGFSSLQTGEFSAELQGDFSNLERLARLADVRGSSGPVSVATQLRGNWKSLDEEPIHSEGRALIQGLSMSALSCEQVAATWNLDVPVGGEEPSLRGTVELRGDRLLAQGIPPLARASVEAEIRGSEAEVALRGSDGPDLVAGLSASVSWANLPSVSITGQRLEVLAGDLLLQATEQFSLRVRDGRYSLDRLLLNSGEGQVTVQGLFDSTRSQLSSTVRIRSFDLASLSSPLERLRPERTTEAVLGLGGQVEDVLVKLSGSLSNPDISLRTEVDGLAFAGYGPLDLSADLRLEDGVVVGEMVSGDSLRLDLAKVPVQLRLAGGQKLELQPSGGWDVTARLSRTSMSELAPLLGRALPRDLEGGTVRGGLSIGGSTENPSVRLDLGLSDLDIAGEQLHGQLGLRLEDGVAEIEDALLKTASSGRVIELEGQAAAQLGAWLLQRLGPAASRRGGPIPMFADLQLHAATRKLPMSLVHRLIPVLEPLTGALQGELDLTGELRAPVARMEARLLGGRVASEELRELRLEWGLAGEKLNGELRVQGKSGGSLDAKVFSSLQIRPGHGLREMLSSPDLSAEITGDGFPLALVSAFLPGTSEPTGALRIDGQVNGSWWSPEPQLALEMSGARLCYEPSSVCYEELRLDGSLETGRLTLRELSFRTIPQVRNPLDLVRSARSTREDARFGIAGFALLDGLRPKWTELDLDLERAWASYTEEVKVQIDGSLRLRGYYPALKLTGEAQLQNMRVDLGRSTTRREVQSLELPEQLRVHRAASEDEGEPGGLVATSESEEEVPTVLDRLLDQGEADITLRMGNNVRAALAVGIAGQGSEALSALNLLGSIEPDLVLGGELSLRHKSKESAVTGAIEMQRGSRLKVLTRDFELEGGSYIEFVGKIPDSQLNLRATYSSRYGPVTVVVSERMASPSIRFESDVFEDQADILSVLVTGKPIAELSTAEGTQALSGVAGALAGFGTKAFGKYTPFDSLVVDLGDDLSSGSAEAGKALGPKVFLVTRFRWGTEEEENRIEGQLEVQINPRLYLETVMGDRLQGAIQLVWKRQF